MGDSKGFSILRLVVIVWLSWLAVALYQIIPQPFGSERSMREIKAWTCMMRQSLFREHSDECEEFLTEMMNNPQLEKIQPPPHLTYDIKSNFSIDRLMADTDNLKLPFIITGFNDNGLEKYKTFDSAKANLADKNYSFEVLEPGSKKNFAESMELPLHDAMDRMKLQRDLYLRFSVNLALDNPPLDEAMVDILDQTKVKESLHFDGPTYGTTPRVGRLCFLGYGSGFTALHNAWMDNWFVQVAGEKTWRIVAPEYAPYISVKAMPVTPANKASISNIPDDSPLPYLDFTTRPGDLFYFPAFWWHEVFNVGEDMNVGCGYRPMVLTLKQVSSRVAIPPLAAHQNIFKNYLTALPSIARKIYQTATEGHEKSMKWWTKKDTLAK